MIQQDTDSWQKNKESKTYKSISSLGAQQYMFLFVYVVGAHVSAMGIPEICHENKTSFGGIFHFLTKPACHG